MQFTDRDKRMASKCSTHFSYRNCSPDQLCTVAQWTWFSNAVLKLSSYSVTITGASPFKLKLSRVWATMFRLALSEDFSQIKREPFWRTSANSWNAEKAVNSCRFLNIVHGENEVVFQELITGDTDKHYMVCRTASGRSMCAARISH